MCAPKPVEGSMRPGHVAVLATVLLGAAVGRAGAQSEPGTVTRSESLSGVEAFVPRWEISVGGQVGAPRGFVKVGEFDRSGTKLGLKGDLGVDTYEDAQLGVAWHI